jgi:hypothetical protein
MKPSIFDAVACIGALAALVGIGGFSWRIALILAGLTLAATALFVEANLHRHAEKQKDKKR